MPVERMRMRPWLEDQINSNTIPGLKCRVPTESSPLLSVVSHMSLLPYLGSSSLPISGNVHSLLNLS
uniref:Uncharacterized protein n=1 Tax=Chrysemys picta bellii TaxID=8478 RepID=A0A8C3FMR5_CHRPI